MTIQPFKTFLSKFGTMQTYHRSIETIKIVNQRLYSSLLRLTQKSPIKHSGIVPFSFLSQFISHK